MKTLFQSGLPDLPNGTDKEAALLRPLYLAARNITDEVARLGGKFELNQAEIAERSQLQFLSANASHRIYVLAAEDSLPYGKLINLYIFGDKIAGRLADRTAAPIGSRRAHAIVDNPGGITLGNYGKALFLEGLSGGISGSVFGDPYYLSTAGDVQLAIPASGFIQPVGYGLGSAGFYLHIN